MKYALPLIVLVLGGCTEDMVAPAATSDLVLAAQYKALGPRGVMTGTEAGIIADAYRSGIATSAAPAVSDMAGGGHERNDSHM